MTLGNKNKNRLGILDISRMQGTVDIMCRAFRDGENVLFEVCTLCGTPVMAFLFRNFPGKSFLWKQEAFAEQFGSLSSRENKKIPVRLVKYLPQREMWKVNTSFGEDLFWIHPEAQIRIDAATTGGCSISLSYAEIGDIAVLNYLDCDTEDEYVLNFAARLKEALHIRSTMRITSYLEGKKLIWYIPPLTAMNNLKEKES